MWSPFSSSHCPQVQSDTAVCRICEALYCKEPRFGFFFGRFRSSASENKQHMFQKKTVLELTYGLIFHEITIFSIIQIYFMNQSLYFLVSNSRLNLIKKLLSVMINDHLSLRLLTFYIIIHYICISEHYMAIKVMNVRFENIN